MSHPHFPRLPSLGFSLLFSLGAPSLWAADFSCLCNRRGEERRGEERRGGERRAQLTRQWRPPLGAVQLGNDSPLSKKALCAAARPHLERGDFSQVTVGQGNLGLGASASPLDREPRGDGASSSARRHQSPAPTQLPYPSPLGSEGHAGSERRKLQFG